MYIAELKGKIPSRLNRSEDILTSNVFSFFNYSRRTIFLKSFFKKLGFSFSNIEINNCEFIFWPNFEDGTEPDLIIIVGDYYLLFEAKLYSGFGKENTSHEEQLIREIKGGLLEAANFKKKFKIIAITEDYYFKKEKFIKVIKSKFEKYLIWINWQLVSETLLELIEKYGSNLPDYNFANDLLKLLEKKNLRAFRTFNKLINSFLNKISPDIFFPKTASEFIKNFGGFKNDLGKLPKIFKVNQRIFLSKNYFLSLKDYKFDNYNNIFFKVRG